MLARLLDRFRPASLRSRVESSIRTGTGLHKGEWMMERPGDADPELDAVASQMVTWCRERIANTRRPYGIDQLALAVACAEPEGTVIASHTFGVFRPVHFYEEGGVAEQVEQFVTSIGFERLHGRDTPVRFAAALFSWGDVARATVFRDELDAVDGAHPATGHIE